MLESMLRHAGYRTALYTSPHLLRFNERVRIDGVETDDSALVAAFEAVEAARTSGPSIALTYFEFSTLAALHLFAAATLDAIVLEVGLGGRLDAVNVVDADVAVVTTIGIDHVDYLGGTRELIGREKAGVFRAGRQAICGDPDPPATLVAHAAAIGAPLWRIGRDYAFVVSGMQWRYNGPRSVRHALPLPALRGFLNNHIELNGLHWSRVRPEQLGDPSLTPFTTGHDLFGDGSLVLLPTPGHTPGSMSLIVRRPGRPPLLMVGDLTYDADLLAAGAVPGVGNKRQLRKAAAAVNELRLRTPGLAVLPAHDPEAAKRLSASLKTPTGQE
jgi:glyoxylase-like metal-dependent hydrolase (beta-lactamase superfamily II)